MLKTIRKISNYLLEPIRSNIFFFMIMYVLGTICIIFEPLAWFGSRFLSQFELFLDIYLLCLLLCIFKGKVRKTIIFILYVFFYIVAIIDMACYIRLGIGISPLYFQMAAQSNMNETIEMLSTYCSPAMLLSPFSFIIILIILHVFVIKEKLFNRLHLFNNTIVPGLFIFLLLAVSIVISSNNKRYFYYRVICQTSELDIQEHEDLTPATGYYIPIYRLLYSFSEYNRLKPVTNVLYNTINNTTVDSCTFRSQNIVLIIGESYNRNHSHLYGYGLSTTPYQDNLASVGNLVYYTDVVSSWNTTCESFENIFSLYSVGDKGKWYQYPFFTTMLKKSGYSTFFLSNQFVTDPGSSFSAFIEDIFINDSIVSKAQFSHRNQHIHSYDEGLIDDYRELSKLSTKNNLWIFHTMGIHAKFSERYPEKWHRFLPSDYHRPDLSDDDIKELSDYDNAIYYNDYVIHSIIDCFKDKDAIVIFFPDHGERIFDNDNEFGRNLSWNKNDVQQQFQIPFWFYYTDLYKQHHREIVEMIEKNKGKRYMTDIISHTILSLAGVKSSYYKPEKNILNEKYDEKRKRIIREQRDFDNL